MIEVDGLSGSGRGLSLVEGPFDFRHSIGFHHPTSSRSPMSLRWLPRAYQSASSMSATSAPTGTGTNKDMAGVEQTCSLTARDACGPLTSSSATGALGPPPPLGAPSAAAA